MSIHSSLRNTLLVSATITLASTVEAQFSVRIVDAPGATEITDINLAESLLISQPALGSGLFGTINFVGGGSDGDFSGGVAFPGGAGGSENFALEALGVILVNVTGSYIFRVNSDDGFRLYRDVNPDGTGGTVYSEFVGPRGPVNTDGPALAISAGTSGVGRLTFFEGHGGEEVELSYSRDGGPFKLVGSTGDITVQPIPEPGSLALLGIGLAGFAARRRRG